MGGVPNAVVGKRCARKQISSDATTPTADWSKSLTVIHLGWRAGKRNGGITHQESSKGMGIKMRIERRYTKEGQSSYADIAFRLTTSEIRNPDGSVVFRAENVEVPEQWSQVASDVLAQKYFRKAGVPSRLKRVEEETVPSS